MRRTQILSNRPRPFYDGRRLTTWEAVDEGRRAGLALAKITADIQLTPPLIMRVWGPVSLDYQLRLLFERGSPRE